MYEDCNLVTCSKVMYENCNFVTCSWVMYEDCNLVTCSKVMYENCNFVTCSWVTSSPKGNDRSPESHYTCCKFALKQLFTIPTRILSMMMCIQNFVSLCQFVLKILSKNRILTSIKGSNSVANFSKNKNLQYQHRSCQ